MLSCLALRGREVVTYKVMNHIFRLSALLLALSTLAAAQAKPPAAPTQTPAAPPQTPAAPPQTAPAPRAAPRPAAASPSTSTLSYAVHVTDKSGTGIGDVAVTLNGPVERSGRTAADGTVTFRSVRGGNYRLRFEHERYITLERDVVAAPRAADVSVALDPAPIVKPVALPPPASPAPAAPATPPAHRAVEPRVLDIPGFLEKNMIKSEPQKLSLLACTDGGTARTLQVRDPLTNHVNAEADEILYVVAGSGIVRIRDQEYKADPGWFALIPRGVPLGARRDGRNPMLALTVSMGAACTETAPLAR
jgi:mannose-6-phosphate isomerase-like protein (cupin superfamily)